MKSKFLRLLPVSILLLSFGPGCASTKMVSAWRLPESGPLEYERIMAMVLVQDPSIRRAGEDALVEQIKEAQAVPSYTVLPERELSDENRVREAINGSGVEAIIVMRPTYDEKEVNYVPGTYPTSYYSFYGYYGWAYPLAYSPGYYRTDRLVGVETNVYDASTGKARLVRPQPDDQPVLCQNSALLK